MVGIYGPRQSDRRAPYSDTGRVDVDLKLASFATRQRGTFRQVTIILVTMPHESNFQLLHRPQGNIPYSICIGYSAYVV